MNPFGIDVSDVIAGSQVVRAFWSALATEDTAALRALLGDELRPAPDVAEVLRRLQVTPASAPYVGTSNKARVLDDGSLMFVCMPTTGQPIEGWKNGPEQAIGWGLRLRKRPSDGAWQIVGIDDEGERKRIDWIDVPAEVYRTSRLATDVATRRN